MITPHHPKVAPYAITAGEDFFSIVRGPGTKYEDHHNRRAVIRLTDNKIFDSVSAAAESVDVHPDYLRGRIKNCKPVGGHYFRMADTSSTDLTT